MSEQVQGNGLSGPKLMVETPKRLRVKKEAVAEEPVLQSAVRKDGLKLGEWKRLLSYRWLISNMGFILFLAGLAIIYIYNGHYADNVSRGISRTTRELKEMEYEYKTIRGDIMFRSKQSEIVKAVELLGLKELQQPPVRVAIKDTVSHSSLR